VTEREYASERAVRYLDNVIASTRQPGARLPTIERMAVSAGVSKATMHRAVRQSAACGAIRAKRGGGITIAEHGGDLRQTAKRDDTPAAWGWGHKAGWLQQRIGRDIANGVFAPGESLMKAKELCVRYGTGYRTLRFALRSVAATGALIPWKRTYQVPPLAATGRRSTILVVGRGTREFLQMVSERTIEFLSTLERECLSRRIRVRFAAMWYEGDSPESMWYGANLTRVLESTAERAELLGTMLFTAAISPDPVMTLVRKLESFAVPCAIIDETGVFGFQLGSGPGRNTRLFSLSWGRSSGEQVGRLLLQLGHRRIAYVTTEVASQWSIDRYDGLRQAMAETGVPEPVTLTALAQDPYSWREGPLLDNGGILSQAGRRMLRGIRHHPPLNRSLLWPEEQVKYLVEANAALKKMAPVFSKMLQDKRITAVVADNDTTAVLCLTLLETRGIRVPQDISVVGFDDEKFALVNNLTSYNFNCRAVILAALRHLLEPSRSANTGPVKKSVEIQGYVVQRGTTGPAPKPADRTGSTA
jgi:hypothetical protein